MGRTSSRAHDWTQSKVDAEHHIEKLSRRGGDVLDPSAGTGTTLAAAARLGRRPLGAEIDAAVWRRANAAVGGE